VSNGRPGLGLPPVRMARRRADAGVSRNRGGGEIKSISSCSFIDDTVQAYIA
jgi:hypothetical protein